MPTVHEILTGFVLPSILAAVALTIAWFPCCKGRDGRWIGALAISGAFALADCVIGGAPRWPPGTGDAAYWIIWFAVPTGILGFLDALLNPPTWLRAGLLFVLARIAASVLIAPLAAQPTWPLQMLADGTALSAVAVWLAWERLAENTAGPLVPVLMILELAAAAAVFGISSNVKPSQASAALAGTAVVAAVAGCLWKIRVDRGAMLAWVVPVFGFLLFVHLYSFTEPPLIAVVLLLGAPLLAFAGDLPICRRWGPRWRWVARLIPFALALALAAGLTARQFTASTPAQPSGQEDAY